jgi:membrane protease YdiL (CAAX protease family)
MKKIIPFIILTCTVSWAAATVAILLGLRVSSGLPYTIFASLYMFLPAVCTILLQKIHKEKPFRNLNISFKFNKWFIIAGIVPIIYVFITLVINLLFPNVSFTSNYEGLFSYLSAEQAELAAQQISKFLPMIFLLITIAQSLFAGYTINAFFAFGEELGWRGYMLKALQGKKFLFASLITGTVWGLWHFPLILIGHNYPQYPIAGVGMMTIWCILLSPVMTYIRIKSKSVITAAIFHGCLNAFAGTVLFYIIGGNNLTNGVTGFAGFIALLFVNIIFFLYDKYITKEHIFISNVRITT